MLYTNPENVASVKNKSPVMLSASVIGPSQSHWMARRRGPGHMEWMVEMGLHSENFSLGTLDKNTIFVCIYIFIKQKLLTTILNSYGTSQLVQVHEKNM